jgi:hypothetical protein
VGHDHLAIRHLTCLSQLDLARIEAGLVELPASACSAMRPLAPPPPPPLLGGPAAATFLCDDALGNGVSHLRGRGGSAVVQCANAEPAFTRMPQASLPCKQVAGEHA